MPPNPNHPNHPITELLANDHWNWQDGHWHDQMQIFLGRLNDEALADVTKLAVLHCAARLSGLIDAADNNSPALPSYELLDQAIRDACKAIERSI